MTGTTTYLVQEREAERLRADYQTLNDTHAKLANDQQEARAMIQLRDDQIAALKRDAADVHRLRAEVDGLSRKLAELEALRARNIEFEKALQQVASRLHGHVTNNTTLLQASEHELQEKGAVRMKEMRQIGLAGVMHADDFDGWFPQSFQEADPYLNGGISLNPARLPIDYAGVELLFAGHRSDIKQPGRTIIARSVEFESSTLGDKIWRYYVFDDGHTEIKSGGSLQEITDWESARIIPSELQSKRP